MSTSKLDVDQAETITAVIPSTGVSPYTYNWLVSTNGGVSYSATTQCATNSGTGQTSSNIVTCSIPGNTLSTIKTYSFELRVSDSSQANEISTSTASSTITVSPQLTQSAQPGIAYSTIDSSQTETITAVLPSTGTSPYSYTWHISVNGGAYSGATQCTANTGSGQIAGNTATCTIPAGTLAGGNTYNFALEVTDSSNTPESSFSASSNTITVAVTPTATSLTPSASQLTVGQSITYNVLLNGGIGPFVANLVASSGAVVNTLTGQFAGTITFGAFVPPAGTDSYNAVITDTGTNVPYIFSSVQNTIQVGTQQSQGGAGSGSPSTNAISSTTSATSTITTVATTATTTVQPQTTPQLNVSGNNVSTTISVPSSGSSTLDLNNGQAYVIVQSTSSGHFNITITNVTRNDTVLLPGYTKLLALRINVTGVAKLQSELNLMMRLSYNCSIPSSEVSHTCW